MTGELRYSLLHIYRNKKKYCWDLASYSIFIIIAIVVGLLGNSFLRSHENYIITKYGSYDACIVNVDVNDNACTELINNNDTSNCYLTSYFYNNDKYYALGYFEKNAYEQMSISLASGRLPTKRGEIAIEESAQYMLTKECDDNGVLTLEITDFYGNSYTEKFQVVGVVNNYSHLAPSIEGSEGVLPYNIFPCILTAPEVDTAITHTIFRTLNDESYELFGRNNYLLNNSKLQNKISTEHVVFSLIFILVIVLGFLSLYSNILVNKKNRQEHIYLLKCSGATNIVCIRLGLITLSIILLFSVIIGISLGLTLSFLLTKLIQNYIVEYIVFHISPIIVSVAILVAIITIFMFSLLFDILWCRRRPLQINPEYIQESKGVTIKTKIFSRHPILSVAIKDVYANTGKYTSIIFSIFCMLALTIVTQAVVSSVVQSYSLEMTSDYLIESYNGGTITSFAIPTTNYHFTDEDINNITASKETESCYAYSRNLMYILLDNEQEEPPRHVLVNHKEDYAQTEERLQYLQNEYLEYGYDADDRLYTVALWGVNDTFLEDLLSDSHISEKIGNQAVLFTTNDSGYYHENDRILFTAPRKNENGQFCRVDIETTIARIVVIDKNSPFYYNLYNGSGYFFCISQNVIDEKIATGYHTLLINLIDPNQYKETEQVLEQLNVIHEDELQHKYISYREYNKERQETIALTQTIGGIIIVAISLYSLVMLVTISRNDLYNQKRIWGYLRASGLKRNQAILMESLKILLLNVVSFSFILTLIGLIYIVSDDFDRIYFSSILSPIAVFLPPLLIAIVTQGVGVVIIKRFWRAKIVELTRAM